MATTKAGADKPTLDLRGPDLEAKLAFLRSPAAYPGGTPNVEAVETHLSWVFLTEDRVYKLKKPVRHEHGDLSTIEGRRHNCLEELRLNRRLAAPVYLDVVPLVRDGDGLLKLGGDGAPVDWLVVMKRLPEEATLHRRILNGSATPADIERIGALLAAFYRDATPVQTNPDEYCLRLRDRFLRESQTLSQPAFDLPTKQVQAISARALAFADRHAELIRGRAQKDRVIEAHGDLRPEHIFLLPRPMVIDCLEFSRALRLLDPVEELAYLAMECAHLGAHWVGEVLFRIYFDHSGDRASVELIRFYRCGRALLRARLAIAHIEEPNVRDPGKWRRQALGYLDLAFADAAALSPDR